MYGIGADFGIATPISDFEGPKNLPFTRAFGRYYFQSQYGLEVGFGVGILEAVDKRDFFSSVIFPFDVSFIVHPISEGKILPYLFGGIGIAFLDYSERNIQRLPRIPRGQESPATTYLPVGLGAEYYLNDQSAIGVRGTYSLGFSDHLDDFNNGGGNDSYWNITLTLFAFLRAVDNDIDKDGLLNDEEKQIGTDPRNPDTDGEGLRDGEEVRTYKTNPLNKDTDGDNCNDKEEVVTYKTDALKKDTDGDGLGDCDEILTHKTDPFKADTDGDGLSDGDEVLQYHSDPINPDTDGDGLTDGEEVLTHKTDPTRVDTDGEGLNDYDEVMKYRSNPLIPDTDTGGVDDAKEVQLGLNPTDSADDVPMISIGERVILEGVNFETGKTVLLPSARLVLDEVAASLQSFLTAEVAIHGHTDNVGAVKYNMKLSQGRADAVKNYLITKGIPGVRIATKGFGYTKPIADNSTPDGRAKNRRIEFIRLK